MGGKEVLSSEVESSLPSKLKLFLNEWRHPQLSLTRIQPKRSKGWGPSGDKKNMVHVSLKQKHPSKLEQYLKWCYKLEGIEMGSQSYLQSNHNTLLPPPKKKNPNWSPWNQRGNLLSSNKHSKTHTNIDSHQHWRNLLTDWQNLGEFRVLRHQWNCYMCFNKFHRK